MLKTMSKESENLGLVVVNEEIDNALDLYPAEPYKTAFANPELRQKLVAYVINGIQGIYPVLINKPSFPAKSKFPYHSLELRLHIENYVHWGIEHLCATKMNWVGHLTPQEVQPSYTPSHRLG